MVNTIDEVNIPLAIAHRYRNGEDVWYWRGTNPIGNSSLDVVEWDTDLSSVPKPSESDIIAWENDRLDKVNAIQADFDNATQFIDDALANGTSFALLNIIGQIIGDLRKFGGGSPPTLTGLYDNFVTISNDAPGIQTAAQNFAANIYGVSTFVTTDMTDDEKRDTILSFLLITTAGFAEAWAAYENSRPPNGIPQTPPGS